ncbi:MAG TPA: hypothetical protein VG899_15685 [Mycobacteriales bacterium]|nr:hypothetical protein [Mycobacteriales bacterium]
MVGETTRRRRRPSAAQPAGARSADGALIVRKAEPSTREVARYRFDALLSRGPMGVILLLLAVTMAFVVVSAAIISLAHLEYGGTHRGFGEDFWQSLLRVLDSGTFASDTDWAVRVIALIVTLSGIFIASALIGIIATGFEQRIEALRRGRGAVIESGHTVVLGRSPLLFTILSELAIANESRRRPAVVVLSVSEKAELEDEIAARVGDLRNTRLIVRTGDPANPANLERIAITSARSVIVLADADTDGDASAVKAALAAHALRGDDDVPIVVELESESTAAALVAACGERVRPVHATDIIAKVVAQACRQAGLGAVYRELLDFDGDEMYTYPATDVVSRRFGEVLLAYAGCTVIGVQHGDGRLSLCPDLTLELAADDSLLLIAEDDSAISFTGVPEVTPAPARRGRAVRESGAQRLLVIGWSDLGGRIVSGIDEMLPRGARLDVVVDPAVVDPSEVVVAGMKHRLHAIADPGVGNLSVADFDQIFVLGYRGHLTPAEADARTLLTIITLNRELAAAAHRPRVVAEVLESRTVPLAATAGLDDFVVSDDLASLLMAQLSENPQLAAVFGELFGATGPTIAMRPAGRYVSSDEHPWGGVVLAVAAAGDLAIGYRNAADAVVVNPAAGEPVTLGEDDQVVVLTRRSLG